MGGLCQTCGWFFGMFKYSSEIQKFEPLRQFNFPFFGIDINLHENIERCILETFIIRNERRNERIFIFILLIFLHMVVCSVVSYLNWRQRESINQKINL